MMYLWIIAAVVAYFIKGLCGFANALIFTSIMSFGTANANISPIDLLMGYPANLFLTWKNRKSLNPKIYLPLAALVLAGSIPGAFLLKNVDVRAVKLVFGVVVVALGTEMFLREYSSKPARSSKLVLALIGLAAAGAQYAALTGITVHIMFDELEKASPIPLVSMVDAARDHAVVQGYKKICLLGTLPTMEGTFFQKSFAECGIEVVTPNAVERNYIGEIIETELEYGKVLPETQQAFKEIAERIIREEQVQAIVLGCTELPLIFNGVVLPIPYIDVMQVHIQALVDLIMRD